MDNVTHTLFGLTLARTSLGRTRGATVALALASNAPDIDILASSGGALRYLTWHRGISHGPLGIVGLGVLVAGLVWAGLRLSGRDPGGRASFTTLAALSVLGTLLHVLMDLPTSYGVRLLSPFDWHYFGADWMPIVDIYLLVALAAGLYFGGRSPAARTINVVIVLSLMVVNYGVRAVAHHQAMMLAPRLFGPTLPQPCPGARSPGRSPINRWPRETQPMLPAPGEIRCLIEIAAMPTFVSPFDWRVIAQLSNAYQLQDVNVLDRRFFHPPPEPEVLWRLSSRYPNQWTATAMAAADAPTARVFLGFSRFPFVRSFGAPGGAATVQFSDVRFIQNGPLRPGAARGRSGGGRGRGGPPAPPSIFTATVQLDAAGHVLEERLGP